MPITLFLTRTPLKEFVLHNGKSGRFGELIAVNCPKVASAKIIPGGSLPSQDMSHIVPMPMPSLLPGSTATTPFPALSRTAAFQAVTRPTPAQSNTRTTPMPAMSRTAAMQAIARPAFTTGLHGAFGAALTPSTDHKQFVKTEHGVLEITLAPTPGQTVPSTPLASDVKRFTTIERFKADVGKGFYVQMHPDPKPYWIMFEGGNPAVKKLRTDHDGRCFRVHGGRSTPEQGILIHEAPHVGWVIGCIGPRPLNNFTLEFRNERNNESYKAMDELFAFVGRTRADFFVLDW